MDGFVKHVQCFVFICLRSLGKYLYVCTYLWPCIVSYSLFCEATFCGVPSCVFDKLGCAARKKRLRSTVLGNHETKFDAICHWSFTQNLTEWIYFSSCRSNISLNPTLHEIQMERQQLKKETLIVKERGRLNFAYLKYASHYGLLFLVHFLVSWIFNVIQGK
jgi:hypothetical protein